MLIAADSRLGDEAVTPAPMQLSIPLQTVAPALDRRTAEIIFGVAGGLVGGIIGAFLGGMIVQIAKGVGSAVVPYRVKVLS